MVGRDAARRGMGAKPSYVPAPPPGISPWAKPSVTEGPPQLTAEAFPPLPSKPATAAPSQVPAPNPILKERPTSNASPPKALSPPVKATEESGSVRDAFNLAFSVIDAIDLDALVAFAEAFKSAKTASTKVEVITEHALLLKSVRQFVESGTPQ
ncbi:proline-rich receptor-like protein kinase PERK9 [Pieris napi]|uniref:proline-rich receptor-like protein kinase PERK9 n=1 Tax=Pieris napi TaxID=78633 RepID=UPI001FBACC1C|nr:proline-rich receptor-like protein kinase PERK9 [Pieris napi]